MYEETRQQRKHLYTNILVLAGVSLALGLVFNGLFYGKSLGLSFPVYILLILFSVLLLAKTFQTPLPRSLVLFIVPLLFFAAMVFVRADELLTFFNVLLCLYLLVRLTDILRKPDVRHALVADYIAPVVVLPFKYLRTYFTAMADLLTLRGVIREQRALTQVLRGILMAVPVLVLFLVLFASADLVFSKFLTNLINIEIDVETAYRAVLVLFVASGFLGALRYMLHLTDHAGTHSAVSSQSYSVGVIESSVLLGALNALFLIFLVIQITYLFGGEQTIAAQGFTYAEYARRGFFELIIVALVSLLLLWTIEKYIVRKSNGHGIAFQALGSVLILQVMVIMISAFYRLLLYENAYGFTTTRLYSHVFILWIAVVFVFLLAKIFFNQREHAFAWNCFVSIVVFLAFMNIMNLDAFIARKNIDRFAAIGKIDLTYLSILSDDATGETVKLLNTPNEEVRNATAHLLYYQWQNLRRRAENGPWQSTNLSRTSALHMLNTHATILEQNKDRSVDPLQYR